MVSDDELCLSIASRKVNRSTPLRTQQDMMYILGHVEGHDDLTDRGRDLQDKTIERIVKSKIECPVTNFLQVYTLRKIKLRTRQAYHAKANDPVRVIYLRGRI